MMLLKKGSQGELVKSLQEILKQLGYYSGRIDGDFGPKTEKSVMAFQEAFSLYTDGVVGEITWGKLQKALEIEIDEQTIQLRPQSDRMEWVRVPADKYRDGYDRFFLREDAAAAYMNVREKVVAAGGVLTSSGARRSLDAHVSASRSATSFHYTGLALDLYVGSGMESPSRDPYVVVPDGDRYWRVFARAEGGSAMNLDAFTYGSRKNSRKVSGKFLDLTALFDVEGFKRIRVRPSFFNGGTWLGAEWWHFQYEKGLEKGVSTFGQELLKVYSEEQLLGSAPWNYKDKVFGVSWA